MTTWWDRQSSFCGIGFGTAKLNPCNFYWIFFCAASCMHAKITIHFITHRKSCTMWANPNFLFRCSLVNGRALRFSLKKIERIYFHSSNSMINSSSTRSLMSYQFSTFINCSHVFVVHTYFIWGLINQWRNWFFYFILIFVCFFSVFRFDNIPNRQISCVPRVIEKKKMKIKKIAHTRTRYNATNYALSIGYE